MPGYFVNIWVAEKYGGVPVLEKKSNRLMKHQDEHRS